ncbi:amidohydrolase family protein [Ascidiimonas sp. W6]|uniref:amidohydrolase family protein n=1 Tax=Ascidiimonas meishanensis TaxID=3128903 RepID=UPI0030EF084E
MISIRKIICCSFLLIISSCSLIKKPTYDLLIENINVIDYKSGKIISNQNIGILEDSILFVRHYSNNQDKKAKKIIKGTGKYAIPGLWDNHIHLRGGDSLIKANKEFLSLFIANGITGIRDAGGDLSVQIRKWRNEINKGILVGPKIYTSGPKIDGAKSRWPGSIEVEDISQVEKALDSLEAIEADFIKLYDSKISRTVYLEVLKQAKSRNMITSGHMPFTVLLNENIENGIGSIEHLYYILKGCSSKEEEVTHKISNGELGFWDSFEILMNSYDAETAKNSFQLMRNHNTFVTPTLYIGNVLSNLKTTKHEHDTYLEYINNSLANTYKGRVNSALNANEERYQMRLKLQHKFQELTAYLQKAEVSLLAGSDCGAFNSYIYPGISLHQELEAMVAAGLSNIEALRTSTYNGASFLRQDDFYGLIAQGKAADILLLDKNPLIDITHTRKIHMLIYKGKVFSKDRLNQLKQATKN